MLCCFQEVASQLGLVAAAVFRHSSKGSPVFTCNARGSGSDGMLGDTCVFVCLLLPVLISACALEVVKMDPPLQKLGMCHVLSVSRKKMTFS